VQDLGEFPIGWPAPQGAPDFQWNQRHVAELEQVPRGGDPGIQRAL
jgi:hypothetical protein